MKVSMRALKNRHIAIASMGAFLVLFMEIGFITGIVPVYAKIDLEMDLIQIGLILSSVSIGRVAGTVFCGSVSDKIGRKPVLIGNFLIAILVLLLFPMVKAFETLLFLLLLAGFASGSILAVIPALVADSVMPSVRGMAMGVFRTFMDAGGLVGPMALVLIFTSFGIEAVCLALSALMLIGTLIIALSRK